MPILAPLHGTRAPRDARVVPELPRRRYLVGWRGSHRKLLAGIALGLLFATLPAFAEDPDEDALEQRPHDAPRKPSGPLPTGPSARVEAAGLTSVQVNVRNGANILGDAANEPSLAVDPTNPNHLAIGWRQFDSVLSDFREAGWAYSRDAGRTWHFPGVLESDVFRSDPVLGFDTDGTFYYSSLTSDALGLHVDLFTSSNGGVSWLGPFDAFGGDKQWIAVDHTGGIGHGNIYQAWSTAAGCCGRNTFTRSTTGGVTFELPVAIPSSPIWGSIDVGPDGALHVAGLARGDGSRVVVATSTLIGHAEYLPFFDRVATVDLGGNITAVLGSESPNPDGLLGQAWVAADHSSGPTAGWLYVVCTVDPPGDDPSDVMFARSTDGGVTWSQPVRLNDDASGNWNWMATMSVAPNGRIDVAWNDTRNTSAMEWSELHYCVSMDGGTHWSGNARISPAWNSHVGWPMQQKIGDYYHMISDNAGANLAYAATFNGEQDVWFMRIGDFRLQRQRRRRRDRHRQAHEHGLERQRYPRQLRRTDTERRAAAGSRVAPLSERAESVQSAHPHRLRAGGGRAGAHRHHRRDGQTGSVVGNSGCRGAESHRLGRHRCCRSRRRFGRLLVPGHERRVERVAPDGAGALIRTHLSRGDAAHAAWPIANE
jgi:hypothetical protein